MEQINKKFLIYFTILLLSLSSLAKAEEEEVLLQTVSDQIKVLTKDLKTLEKAVYEKSDIISPINSSKLQSDGLNEDI